jgi:hypothetical protein
MKQQLVNVLTKVGFLGVMTLVAASAQGQSLSNRFRANIPFDFAVADKPLPAGEYSIARAQQDDTVLLISKVDGRSNSMRLTSPVQTVSPKDKTTLVFHRYGDQYFFFQVWPAGATTGREMSRSRSEREIERKLTANPSAGKMAKNGGAVETVTIAGVLQ